MAETRYSKLTSHELNGLFRANSWKHMDEDAKRDACQELENRLAAERGTEPRTVVSRDMDDGVYGEQSGDKIYVNRHILKDNIQVVRSDETGEIYETHEISSGWYMYDTINHEDEHGAQYDRGDFQTRRSYIKYSTDRDLYRIGKDEAKAFEAGHSHTRAAIAEQVGEGGEYDEDMQYYLEDIEDDSYENALENAKWKYGEDVEQMLSLYTEDRESGIHRDPPSGTYARLDGKMQEQIRQEQEESRRTAMETENAADNPEVSEPDGPEEGYGDGDIETPADEYGTGTEEYGSDGSETLADDYGAETEDYGSETLTDDYGTGTEDYGSDGSETLADDYGTGTEDYGSDGSETLADDYGTGTEDYGSDGSETLGDDYGTGTEDYGSDGSETLGDDYGTGTEDYGSDGSETLADDYGAGTEDYGSDGSETLADDYGTSGTDYGADSAGMSSGGEDAGSDGGTGSQSNSQGME